MPGFPDKYMPFMEPDSWGSAAANFERFVRAGDPLLPQAAHQEQVRRRAGVAQAQLAARDRLPGTELRMRVTGDKAKSPEFH